MGKKAKTNQCECGRLMANGDKNYRGKFLKLRVIRQQGNVEKDLATVVIAITDRTNVCEKSVSDIIDVINKHLRNPEPKSVYGGFAVESGGIENDN